MRTITITNESVIDTLEGFLVVKSRNVGGLVYCDNYEVDETGIGMFTGERMLTLNEIAHAMHDVDGKNYRVRWEDRDLQGEE